MFAQNAIVTQLVAIIEEINQLPAKPLSKDDEMLTPDGSCALILSIYTFFRKVINKNKSIKGVINEDKNTLLSLKYTFVCRLTKAHKVIHYSPLNFFQ